MAAITQVTITWTDTSGDGVGAIDDVLYGMLYNETKDEIQTITEAPERGDSNVVVEVPDGWEDSDTIHIYGAWRRADGLDASDTMYAVATV